MKKVLSIFLIIIFLTGCQTNPNLSEEKEIYQNMLKKLELVSNDEFMEPLPFDINVYVDKVIESEIMYRVIINNPIESLKNISVIAIHNYPTRDIFPSIGIFDEKVNLVPKVIDMKNNYVKGISLTGYILYEGDITTFSATFKVIVEYEDELGNIVNDYYRYQN